MSTNVTVEKRGGFGVPPCGLNPCRCGRGCSSRYTAEKTCCTVCDRSKVCHVCGTQTLVACSDCRINFGAVVYVCGKPACRQEHERKCWGDKP